MCNKQHSNHKDEQRQDKGARLTEPIDVLDKGIIYELPSDDIAPESLQIWNGYTPECTVTDDKCYPIQKENIKRDKLYRGIECEGDEWMKMACDVALDSVKDEAGGPFGALVLQIDKATNKVIRYWKNHNQVTSANDPTAHAEVMTIRSTCQSLGVFDLGEIHQEDALLPQPSELSYCVVYSSTEPCPMCYSAICWAKLQALVFAATRFDAAAEGVDFSDEALYNELATPYPERMLKVIQATTGNSLDAFNLWKRSDKVAY